MTSNAEIPTLADIWSFLQDFRAVTESAFNRLAGDVSVLKTDVRDLKAGMYRVERRLVYMDDRVVARPR